MDGHSPHSMGADRNTFDCLIHDFLVGIADVATEAAKTLAEREEPLLPVRQQRALAKLASVHGYLLSTKDEIVSGNEDDGDPAMVAGDDE